MEAASGVGEEAVAVVITAASLAKTACMLARSFRGYAAAAMLSKGARAIGDV